MQVIFAISLASEYLHCTFTYFKDGNYTLELTIHHRIPFYEFFNNS